MSFDREPSVLICLHVLSVLTGRGYAHFRARGANNDDVALFKICYAHKGPERQIMMTFLCGLPI